MALTQLIFTEHLTPILQEMMMQRQTGLLSLEHVTEVGREHGEIHFEAGEVTIASTGHHVGVAALAAIRTWQHVYYTFYEDATVPLYRITEDRSTHQPVTTGADRHRRLSGVLPLPSKEQGLPRSTRPLPQVPATPQPQAVPAPIAQDQVLYPGVDAIFRALPRVATAATMNRLERRERIIFALLDGRRTLRDVARLTHQTEVRVARILVQLLSYGYIECLRG